MQGSNAAILQSSNLFVYVMNNPLRWIDPSGLFAETFNLIDDCQGFIPAAAVAARPVAPRTPTATIMVGGPARQNVIVTVPIPPASQQVQNIVDTAIDVGVAVAHSLTLELGSIAGVGGTGQMGPVSVTAQAAYGPYSIFSIDGEHVGRRFVAGISATVFGQFGVGGAVRVSSSSVTAYNYSVWLAPDRRVEAFIGIKGPGGTSIGFSNIPNYDLKVSIGGGLYVGVGADAELSFNISEFRRQWRSRR